MFFNREKDLRRLKTVLSGEPNLVYFLYGPINSGKTALLTKVFEELPEDYRIFYVNFRARDVEGVKDLLRVIFRVRASEEKLGTFLEKILRAGGKIVEKVGGVPVPEDIFDLLFNRTDKVEDIFAFMEEYFLRINEKGYRVVFALDELQTIKEVVNASGKPVLGRLFNFLVGMTKETHLCHCLCATSDCLFIEEIYAGACQFLCVWT